MAANEEQKLEKIEVISQDGSEDQGLKDGQNSSIDGSTKRKRNQEEEERKEGSDSNDGRSGCGAADDRDKYVYRTKAEEYKMLADLSGFPELAAMFALEARMKELRKKKKKRRKKKKKKQKLETQATDVKKPEKVAAKEDKNLEKIVVISLDSGEDEGERSGQSSAIDKMRKEHNEEEEKKEGSNSNGGRSVGVVDNRDKFVYRTKAEEYTMLADLTNFPELAAMFAFEARMKELKSKRKKKQKLDTQASSTTLHLVAYTIDD